MYVYNNNILVVEVVCFLFIYIICYSTKCPFNAETFYSVKKVYFFHLLKIS